MSGLTLTEYEVAQRDELLKRLGHDAMADLEETCEGSASYHYEVHPSGIGDSVYLVFRGERHYISDPASF